MGQQCALTFRSAIDRQSTPSNGLGYTSVVGENLTVYKQAESTVCRCEYNNETALREFWSAVIIVVAVQWSAPFD
jgi:hypothetical protein